VGEEEAAVAPKKKTSSTVATTDAGGGRWAPGEQRRRGHSLLPLRRARMRRSAVPGLLLRLSLPFLPSPAARERNGWRMLE
jgi:hypothetical protein